MKTTTHRGYRMVEVGPMNVEIYDANGQRVIRVLNVAQALRVIDAATVR